MAREGHFEGFRQLKGEWSNSKVLIVYFYDIEDAKESETRSYEFHKCEVEIDSTQIRLKIHWPSEWGGTSTYIGENRGTGHFTIREQRWPGRGSLHYRKGFEEKGWPGFVEDVKNLREDNTWEILEGYAECKWDENASFRDHVLTPQKYGYWFWKVRLMK